MGRRKKSQGKGEWSVAVKKSDKNKTKQTKPKQEWQEKRQ